MCLFREIPGRYGLAKAAAAGPLTSLGAGLAAGVAWRATGWVALGGLAIANLLAAVGTWMPRRTREDGVWEVSDGLWVARALGLVRPPRTLPAPTEPIVGLPAAVLLVLVGVVVVVVAPWYLLLLVPVFTVAWFVDADDRRRVLTEAAPQSEEPWDTGRSKPPPAGR